MARVSKQERLEMVKNLEPMSKGCLQLLKDEGFKTGSSVYSNAVPLDEDWCIMVPPRAFDPFVLKASGDYFNTKDGMCSIYGRKADGTYINIMCISDVELYEAWKHTTVIMQVLAKTVPTDVLGNKELGEALKSYQQMMNNKWNRVRMFRAFKDIFFWPKPLEEPRDVITARNYSKCILCGGEAINFTCADAKRHYLIVGECERCHAQE